MELTYLGHAGWRIQSEKLTIYIDPFKIESGPKAHILCITHDHFDHLDQASIEKIRTAETVVLSTRNTAEALDGIGLDPDDPGRRAFQLGPLSITAVQAYNREKNYHSRGFGIGFVIAVTRSTDSQRLYHAGDTDSIEEMTQLAPLRLNLALLPIGGTYTMDQREAVEAAKKIEAEVVESWKEVAK